MVDQCIVCLDNLDAAGLSAVPSPREVLELPTPGVDEGGGALLVVADGSSSTTNTNTTDDALPGNPANHDHVAVINVCGHMLHNSCLLEWTGKANSCPICRQSFHLVNVYDRVGGNLLSSYKVEDKKQIAEFDPQAWLDENPEDEEEAAVPCPICGSAGDEGVLLLCDGCDACYHTYCIGLDEVPDDAWFCMECAPLFGQVQVLEYRPRRQSSPQPSHTGNHRLRPSRRRNGFFPRTRASVRRARRQARSDEWQGAWGEITGLVFDALDLDLDSHDGDDALESYRRSRQVREREQREYERWQQRLSIARRLGAQDAFVPNVLFPQRPQPVALSEAVEPVVTPQSREERRAWGALDKARECNGEGPSNRKRKSRSITGSPVEPPPAEAERKLKRPRTRRVAAAVEASSSKSPSRTEGRAEAAMNGASSSNARSPGLPEEVPSFLASLLKEVENSNPSDDETFRAFLGENRIGADPSSPGSSPPVSAYNSPRALSLTPPPLQQSKTTRPTSPTMSLSSHIEPIYPPANYLPNRSVGETSDSESRPFNQAVLEVRQPRPRRSHALRLPRSPDVSPTRAALPLETKESISGIVRAVLKPHWKASKITADQYANINREVSRKLYDEVTNPASVVDDEARLIWEKKATQEVARALAGLPA